MVNNLVASLASCVLSLASCVLNPLQLSRELYKSPLFMQNKPKVKIGKMNVTSYITKNYENKSNWTLGKRGKNKPKQIQPVVSLPALSLSKGAHIIHYPSSFVFLLSSFLFRPSSVIQIYLTLSTLPATRMAGLAHSSLLKSKIQLPFC